MMLRRIWQKLPDAWKWCLPIWLTSRLALMGWGWMMWSTGMISKIEKIPLYFEIQPITEGWQGALLGAWLRWDVVNYLRIANFGYNSLDLSAFFPLLPFLGRTLNYLFGLDTLTGMMLISNAALLPAMVLLYRISEKLTSSQIGRGAVLMLIFFPMSFYFYAAYPHSLSLLLILGAVWSAYHDRWGATAVCGLLAGLAHSVNLALIFLLTPIAINHWKTKHPWRLISSTLAAITPLLGYFVFMGYRSALGFPPIHQTEFMVWHNHFLMPWKIPFELIRMVESDIFPLSGWFRLLVMVLGLCALVYSFPWRLAPGRKIHTREGQLPYMVWLFMAVSLSYMVLITNVEDPFNSCIRRVIQIFPLYIVMAQWVHKKRSRALVIGSFYGLQLYFTSLFLMWVWVS